MMEKLVENNHYHIWTDALHARALAHQAKNRWDLGTYVRWAVITAWTVLEVACQDAMEDASISYSFRKNLDDAITKKTLPKLIWGSGVWQKVTILQELRKDFVHRSDEANLFPDAGVADDAITVVRDAVEAIYAHVGKDAPKWVSDDEDRGWDKASTFASAPLIRAGTGRDDPNAILFKYIYKDREFVSEILASDADWRKYYQEFLDGLRIPITKVIVSQGPKILEEKSFTIRGN